MTMRDRMDSSQPESLGGNLAQLARAIYDLQTAERELGGDPGPTRPEIQAYMGWSKEKIFRFLHMLLASGRVRVGTGVRTNYAGIIYRPPVFMLQADEEEQGEEQHGGDSAA